MVVRRATSSTSRDVVDALVRLGDPRPGRDLERRRRTADVDRGAGETVERAAGVRARTRHGRCGPATCATRRFRRPPASAGLEAGRLARPRDPGARGRSRRAPEYRLSPGSVTQRGSVGRRSDRRFRPARAARRSGGRARRGPPSGRRDGRSRRTRAGVSAALTIAEVQPGLDRGRKPAASIARLSIPWSAP